MMLNVNMFNANMKLRVFDQRYNVLIIVINHYYLKIFNVEIELIKKLAQLNCFFDNLNLIDVFDFID